MQIVDILYEIARRHKLIRGFMYGRSSGKGSASETHPLVWVDDPITAQSAGPTLRYTINVDFLDLPVGDLTVKAAQGSMLTIGLDFVEKLKTLRTVTGYSVDGYRLITLSEYYDNAAAGVRMTISLVQANPANLCADNFDAGKQFPSVEVLPVFEVENPGGCAVFSGAPGLPDFKIDAK